MVVTAGATILGGKSSSVLDLAAQTKAWRFYGTPEGTAASNIRSNQGAIGEVRFVMGWVAQQIGRIHWDVVVNGTALSQEDSDELMAKVSNEESTIILSTNMVVAGELNYVAMSRQKLEGLAEMDRLANLVGPDYPGEDDALWIPISVIDNNRTELLQAADLGFRAVWPHPAKPQVADPPLFSVLDILEEIEQLQDLAYSQNRSRIAQMGILTIANELEMSNTDGIGGDFHSQLERVINSPIADPRKTSAAPIILTAPFEYMTGALSNGARAVQWTKPVQDFDERLDDKMKFAIQRLAWGFPVAPEILLGMTSTNRAVAFQIEESTYRSHVEPIAKLVGRIYARALKMILEGDDNKVEVKPDATELLARRHSVADAKDAYDRGLVRAEWVRRVLGISEEDAATEEDLDRITYLRKGDNPGQGREADPSEVSSNESVRASAALDDDGLVEALRGAVDMSLRTAISRIGASARTKLSRLSTTPSFNLDPENIPNGRLPSMLGPDRVAELGLVVPEVVQPVVESLVTWWEELVLDVHPEFDGTEELAQSRSVLLESFVDWCCATSCSWPLYKAPDAFSESVLRPLQDLMLVSEAESEGEV